MVQIPVGSARLGRPVEPVLHFFGADERSDASRKDGRTILAMMGQPSPERVYFRPPNRLSSGDGTPALKEGSTSAPREGANRSGI
jgi:xylan 1,4-beta-xylosidase